MLGVGYKMLTSYFSQNVFNNHDKKCWVDNVQVGNVLSG